MFVVTVTFALKPRRATQFLELIGKNSAQSLADEPGCHRFDVCVSDDRPGEVFLYEVYVDVAAFDSHKSMPHYRAFTDAAAPLVEEKRVATYRLTEVPG